jgi:lycopene beta-cyclase
MEAYDFILLGGGAAGLSLAHRLLHSPLGRCSLLVIDKDGTALAKRTWCFWTDQPGPFDHLAHRTWHRLRFCAPGVDVTRELGPYRYLMLRASDVADAVHREFRARGHVHVVHGHVQGPEDGPAGACVTVHGRQYRGRWIFDSRQAVVPPGRPARGEHSILQSFTGWEVTTPTPTFSPDVITLCDFRTPQQGAARFFYILPLSNRRALIEYVCCLPHQVPEMDREAALHCYLRGVLHLDTYERCAHETGVTLLTDRPFRRQLSLHRMTIGALGGQVKPSTGYAFGRIQRDSTAIVSSLLRTGHPFAVQAGPGRFRRYDAALLDIMEQEGERIAPIFAALFRRNPVTRILRFLDERTAPWEDALLAATLPLDLAWRAVRPRAPTADHERS